MSFPVLKSIAASSGLAVLSFTLFLVGQESVQQPKSVQAAAPSATGAPHQQTEAESPVPAPSSAAAQQPSVPAIPSTLQNQAQPQQANASAAERVPGTVLKVITRMVLVDVVAMDHSGKPILDLKPEDFEVKENGTVQKIRGFGVTKEASLTTANTPPALKARVLPTGIFTNIPDFQPESGPPTVLLIDALNTALQDQAYLHHELVKYLQGLEPRRNVAIYTLGNRLRLLQDFTTDPQLLQSALKKLTSHTSILNENLEAGPDDLIASEMGDTSRLEPQMLQSLRDFESEQIAFRTDMRVAITMDALKQIARNVAGYPGRKNLVWLSGAFPLSIFPDTELTTNYLSAQRQYGDRVRETASVLTDAQIAVYPVDARGLVGSLIPDASSSGRDATGSVRRGRAFGNELSRRSYSLASSHDSMNQLADQTGGHAFYNRNDIDHAIALSVAEGSTYYTLGYYPENKDWDGKFRKLEVKVTQPGAHLRYRKGYFAIDPGSATQKNEKVARSDFFAALAPESPMATSLPVIVRVTPPTKEEHAVLIDFSIEPHGISFEPQGDLHHAELDFISIAFDQKGQQVKNESESMNANLKPATYREVMKHGLRMRQKLDLAPGKYLLKMGVRDLRSNLIGTITAPVEVPQS